MFEKKKKNEVVKCWVVINIDVICETIIMPTLNYKSRKFYVYKENVLKAKKSLN